MTGHWRQREGWAERRRERAPDTEKVAERQIEALPGEMANSLILWWPVLPALGGEGSRGKEGKKRRREGGKKMVSVSSLYAAILFSGFPFHEEIVASRVTLPFKGKGKRACVLEHKGIHSPTRPSSSNSLDSPHDTHHCRHSRGEILRKLARPWFCAHL